MSANWELPKHCIPCLANTMGVTSLTFLTQDIVTHLIYRKGNLFGYGAMQAINNSKKWPRNRMGTLA